MFNIHLDDDTVAAVHFDRFSGDSKPDVSYDDVDKLFAGNCAELT
jgi:hypothetical protein